jgi:hypothetical protein
MRPEPVVAFDRSQLFPHTDTLARRFTEGVGDTVVFQLHLTDDSVLGTIDTFGHDSLSQHVVVTFDIHSLRPVRVRAFDKQEIVDLAYSADSVRGKRIVSNPAGTQDTLVVIFGIDSGTLDRRSLLVVTPWLPLAPGRVFAIPVFDSWTQSVVPVRIAVGHESPITVPSGTFRAYRLDVTTLRATGRSAFGLFPTIIYVSVDSPRVLLRFDRPRQNAVTELISRRSP